MLPHPNQPPTKQISTQSWFERFLPRSSSKAVFLFVVTCYSFTLQKILTSLVRLFGFWPIVSDLRTHKLRQLRPGIDDVTNTFMSTVVDPLVIAPILESLMLIGTIEALRRLKFNTGVQIAVSASLLCLLHSTRYALWGVSVAPIFFIGAGAYVYWRRSSFWVAAEMVLLLHFFSNGIPFLSVLAERLYR